MRRALLVVLAVVTACSTDASGRNEADVAFARGLVARESQAQALATSAVDQASPDVALLAESIAAESAEVRDTAAGWLEGWEEAVGSNQSPGLEEIDGGAFDVTFLEAMIENREGVVALAQAEIAEGEDDDAVELARRLADEQTTEVDELAGLLAEYGDTSR